MKWMVFAIHTYCLDYLILPNRTWCSAPVYHWGKCCEPIAVASFITSNVRYHSSLASARCCCNFRCVGVSYPHRTHLYKNLLHTNWHLTFNGGVSSPQKGHLQMGVTPCDTFTIQFVCCNFLGKTCSHFVD